MTENDDWESLPWQNWEAEIYRLQHRIFHASETGDHRKMHRLQRLLLASRSIAVNMPQELMESVRCPTDSG